MNTEGAILLITAMINGCKEDYKAGLKANDKYIIDNAVEDFRYCYELAIGDMIDKDQALVLITQPGIRRRK